MIDVTSVVKEFRAPDLRAFINEYLLGDLRYKEFFPSEFTPQLTFESLEATFNAKVAADVVAFDSRAPRKGRKFPGKFTGDIPKIEIARPKKESDLNTYRMLLSAIQNSGNIPQASASAKQRLLNWMYEDTTFCLDGVNARMEWLAKRATTTGEYTLTVVNNEGGVVTPVPIKFGIPAGNITNSGTNWWGSVSTAKPIADIKTQQVAARAAGFNLRFILMDRETFDKIVLTEEVQKYAASFVANALGLQTTPNLQTVNQSLANESLPQIRLWESYVNIESKAGVWSAVSGWEQGRVVFTQGPGLGRSVWTTPADAYVSSDVDKSTKAMNDFVLVKAFAEQDPITVITKAVAYATPVLDGANAIYILKTKQS